MRTVSWWMMRGATALSLIVMLVSAAGVVQGKSKHSAVGLGVGYQPPDFTVNDLMGKTHSLSQYRGNVVVLHFWASWCPYCRQEIPELTTLQQEWVDKGVRVLAISVDQDVATLKRFLAQSPLPYPVIADLQADPSVADQYGVSGIPVTYILSRDGHIASRLNGSAEIIEAVQHALAQSS